MTIATVLITGASSGLGRALALAYAGPGMTLHLGGRDAARLAETVNACTAKGAVVVPRVVDVADGPAMAEWIGQCGQLDLVIANAGIGSGINDGKPEAAAKARATFATNLDGAFNTILPALEIMRAQPPDARGLRGRIAAIASIAGLVITPGAPSYGASKAALDRWMVASAPIAARHGVQLTSICPGFIHTPMTAGGTRAMPGVMSAERAATIIQRAIAAGRVRIAFPWWLAAIGRLLSALPARLATRLLAGGL